MITGRKADTIVTGGENVAPVEVEDVLLTHPDVADAAVFARPDAEWGEAVVASVVLRDGATVAAEELRAFCAQRLAGFKVPKAFEFVVGAAAQPDREAAAPRACLGRLAVAADRRKRPTQRSVSPGLGQIRRWAPKRTQAGSRENEWAVFREGATDHTT